MAYETSFNDAMGMRFSTPDRYCGGPGYTKTPCGISDADLLEGAYSVKSLQTTARQISAISNGVLPVVYPTGDDPVYLSDPNLASNLELVPLIKKMVVWEVLFHPKFRLSQKFR